MFDERIAIGIPSLAGYTMMGALSKARDLGFQSVMVFPDGPRTEHSLGVFPTLAYYGSTQEQKRETVAALAKFKHVAVHQAWDDQWRKWIDCAAFVGADVITVHSGRPSEGQSSAGFLSERSAQLRLMGDYAAKNGVRIGIENEGGVGDVYLELVTTVCHPFVGSTLDVGHCAYFDSVIALRESDERVACLNATIGAMVRSLGDKLFSLHVHDVRQSDWRDHRCVGTGVIDFSGLFAELQHVLYRGLFEIELEEPEMELAAAKTGEYLTRLCHSLRANSPRD